MNEMKTTTSAASLGLIGREVDVLRAARELLARKPEAVLRYLGGDQPPTKALLALALSAQLELSKVVHSNLKVTTELCRYLKLGNDSNTNNVEDGHGSDATPND